MFFYFVLSKSKAFRTSSASLYSLSHSNILPSLPMTWGWIFSIFSFNVSRNSLSLPKTTKEFLEKRSILSKLTNKMDIFIQYFGEKWNENFKAYESRLRLYFIKEKNNKKELAILDFQESDSKSPVKAKMLLFSKLEK